MVRKTNVSKALALTLKKYRRLLEETRIRPEYMAVFGSRVKGTAGRYSDIDVCVVSSDLTADPVNDYVTLMGLARKIDDRIEPHGFVPEDFDPTSNPLAAEIKRTGIVI